MHLLATTATAHAAHRAGIEVVQADRQLQARLKELVGLLGEVWQSYKSLNAGLANLTGYFLGSFIDTAIVF